MIFRTVYELTMFDTENRQRKWNATFADYSSHLLAGKRFPMFLKLLTETSCNTFVVLNCSDTFLALNLFFQFEKV